MFDFDATGFGVPAFLLGAVLVITIATLLLHFLFPPAKGSRRPSAPRDNSTRCPLCQQNLDRAELHGVSMEVCPRCQGVWLSQDKLEQIAG